VIGDRTDIDLGTLPREVWSGCEMDSATLEGETGLGLAIVAGVVEAHGWELRLDDSDAGARFEITGMCPVDGVSA
jgi:signal transduction histidine kinase